VDKVDKLGPWATAFTIFKGFVASGILYMPKNFINGGYLFSALTMAGSLCLTLFCAKLLLDTRAKLGGSFSEIGEKTWGRTGKIMVDVTLVGS
jgi:amino acid permease